MKISARNVFKGKVKQLEHGAVNSGVVVELDGGLEVVSIITKHSAEPLGLTVGKEVYAVIKASNIMIGDPHTPRS
jgi:molybdopterin-binding protein